MCRQARDENITGQQTGRKAQPDNMPGRAKGPAKNLRIRFEEKSDIGQTGRIFEQIPGGCRRYKLKRRIIL